MSAKFLNKLTSLFSRTITKKPLLGGTGIYNDLLNGIANERGFTTEDALVQHLKNLQLAAKNLWRKYRNDNVTVNYSDEGIQDAYLLRYFPHYTIGIQNIPLLKTFFEKKLTTKDEIGVCFFGVGPGPEILGLMELVKKFCKKEISVLCHAFDLYADTWTYSLKILSDHVIPQKGISSHKIDCYKLDILSDDFIGSISDKIIADSQLFIFQNCLNELETEQEDKFIDNLFDLIKAAELNSSFNLIDLNSYSCAQSIFNKLNTRIEQWNKDNSEVTLISKKLSGARLTSPHSKPDKLITENLLNGENGLIPRKYINYCYYSIAKVKRKKK